MTDGIEEDTMSSFSHRARGLVLILIILMLSSWASTPSAPDEKEQHALTEKVDQLFADRDKPDSPGCALGIIRDGQLIYKRGYGMANLEYNIPLSSASVFRIGSTSKQFTAFTIALLAERGKLSLDDDIRNYLPEMPEYESPITIRHLIHHTSGVRDYLTLMDLAGMRDDDFVTEDEVIGLLARQKELNFNPGDEFLYSNSGYFLLSIIAKRATGKSLRELAQKMIFKPLGMTHTHFHDDHTLIVKHRASGYAPGRDGGFKINMTTLDMIGDGGVFTTVEDLVRWDQNFTRQRVGSPRLINQILTPGTLNDGEKLDYAFGLRVSQYKGLNMISHGGAFVGFRAEMIRFPQQKFSVICLCNLSATNPSRLARQVADIYLADQFKQQPKTKAKPATPRPAAQSLRLTANQLTDYVGRYYSQELDVSYNIVLDHDKLFLRHEKWTKDSLNDPLEPMAGDGFGVSGLRLRFLRNQHDEVSAFRLNVGRVKNIRFVKQQTQ